APTGGRRWDAGRSGPRLRHGKARDVRAEARPGALVVEGATWPWARPRVVEPRRGTHRESSGESRVPVQAGDCSPGEQSPYHPAPFGNPTRICGMDHEEPDGAS